MMRTEFDVERLSEWGLAWFSGGLIAYRIGLTAGRSISLAADDRDRLLFARTMCKLGCEESDS